MRGMFLPAKVGPAVEFGFSEQAVIIGNTYDESHRNPFQQAILQK
jgi:hypothetical protein